MNTKILSKCGYRCDLCLAYAPNIKQRDQRKLLSDGWFRLYGFRIPAKDIYCEGCVSSDSPELIDKKCPVRPCVISKGLETCAQCPEYSCKDLKGRMVFRHEIEKKLECSLTEEEYKLFVRPYESKHRLDQIKKAVSKNKK